MSEAASKAVQKKPQPSEGHLNETESRFHEAELWLGKTRHGELRIQLAIACGV